MSKESQSLGELEAEILDVIWDLKPPITSTQVFKIMYPKRELSYSTIMLTMAKLARKGVLTQERTGTKKTDAFVYKANITRQKMGRALLEEVARKIVGKSFPDAVKQIVAAAGK